MLYNKSDDFIEANNFQGYETFKIQLGSRNVSSSTRREREQDIGFSLFTQERNLLKLCFRLFDE